MLSFDNDTPISEDKKRVTVDGITLYESAHRRLASVLANSHGMKFRITLEQSGCAGVSYVAKIDDAREDDRVVEFDDTVHIIVSSAPRFPSKENDGVFYSDWDFLEGLEIKYKESIMSSAFEMDNPNAIRSCPCGISFRPEDYAGKGKKCN